jgi:adenylate kinase
MTMPQPLETNLVFMGGIHGVGKTTYCRGLAPLVGARHLTAGSLIREAGGVQIDKTVANLDQNQVRLLAALERRRAAGERILLDGHFCVLSPSLTIEYIPIAVFRRIAPSRVVLMGAEPGDIFARLQQRDGKAPPLSLIGELAQAEQQHAITVGSALNAPILRITSSTPFEEVSSFLS